LEEEENEKAGVDNVDSVSRRGRRSACKGQLPGGGRGCGGGSKDGRAGVCTDARRACGGQHDEDRDVVANGDDDGSKMGEEKRDVDCASSTDAGVFAADQEDDSDTHEGGGLKEVAGEDNVDSVGRRGRRSACKAQVSGGGRGCGGDSQEGEAGVFTAARRACGCQQDEDRDVAEDGDDDGSEMG
jgi:hypothetical protein